MKIKFSLAFIIFLLLAQGIFAREQPTVSETDRIRLAEAFKIGRAIGNRVWKDWDKAPFAVLLLTPENEFLIRHPKPSPDFISIGYDSLLQSEVYYRKRTFDQRLLATLPAVGGIPTIVIGQAENTSRKTSTDWVVTVLHEHFHQLQYSQPNYYADVNALNLSGGDESGMWMLNYAFPYSETEVKQQFSVLCRLLADALQTTNKKVFSAKVAAYLASRRKLEAMLKPADYKYFSFQIWQEGIARYTEYRIAAIAARQYKPSRQFRNLKDYQPFKEISDKIMENILKELTTLRLEEYERTAFYPLGAGEALLLERANRQWKNHYFSDKFFVDKYFSAT